MTADPKTLDLLVIGAGPAGIAIGAEARRAGLDVLLVDRGPLAASLVGFPTDMTFFTTRDKLEIAGMPFAIPEDKPTRRQALSYYQGIVTHDRIPLALFEEVTSVERDGAEFRVRGRRRTGETDRRARAVAFATGYFAWPRQLGVPGEDLPWVQARYREPWGHFGESVAVIGGGNSACETALELWRHGARVTIVHRRASLKPTIKYWVRPDIENRISEGSIRAYFESEVRAFGDQGVEVERAGERFVLPVRAAYVLIGYRPYTELYASAGVAVDTGTLVPEYDEATCESNVPGLYVAGTVQAGRDTHKIFIENSRDHGVRIVRHLLARLGVIARPEAPSS